MTRKFSSGVTLHFICLLMNAHQCPLSSHSSCTGIHLRTKAAHALLAQRRTHDPLLCCSVIGPLSCERWASLLFVYTWQCRVEWLFFLGWIFKNKTKSFALTLTSSLICSLFVFLLFPFYHLLCRPFFYICCYISLFFYSHRKQNKMFYGSIIADRTNLIVMFVTGQHPLHLHFTCDGISSVGLQLRISFIIY